MRDWKERILLLYLLTAPKQNYFNNVYIKLLTVIVKHNYDSPSYAGLL